jgi:hypothetical protein
MSNLTSELNLSLAVDDDDTADYLTVALSDSLTVVDGMFNATTGHNHNGSHQGGALEFQDLLVSQDLTVVGASELQGPVHAGSNLTVDGTATVVGHTDLTTLDVSGTTLLHGALTIEGGINATNGLTVSGAINATGDITGRYLTTDDGGNGVLAAGHGDLYVRGNIVRVDQPGGLSVAGPAQIGSWLAAGTNLSGVAGDISANRGANTGYLWLGNASHHVGFDGSNYVMPNGNLYVGGDLVVTQTNATTLSNKTLADPRMSAQVQLGGGSYTLGEVGANANKWRFLKAWTVGMTIFLTNGTLILFGTQYTSGQYVLRSGDSLSIYCDGSNWWVL